MSSWEKRLRTAQADQVLSACRSSKGMIKLTFEGIQLKQQTILFHLPLWWCIYYVSSRCLSLLPQPGVLSELSVSPKLGSNRFASVFWDIKGVGKYQMGRRVQDYSNVFVSLCSW